MKQTIIRLIVLALLLAVSGSTPVLADGPGFPPLCYPGDAGCPKVFVRASLDGGQPPLCYPGDVGCPK